MKDELLALAERVEAATVEQQRGLLTDAFHAINGFHPGGRDGQAAAWEVLRMRFYGLIDAGGFLDAAMTMLDDSYVWGVSKQERNPGRNYYYQASAMPFGPIAPGEATAATPALALTAAALRARATKGNEND